MTVGTDSWVTIIEADSYLADKYGASAWASLSSAIKTDLLVSAWRNIYYSAKYNIPKSSTSEFVKSAQIETGWYIYGYNSELEKRGALQAQGVDSFGLSKFSETYNGKFSLIPQIAQGMLQGFEAWDVFATFDRDLD